MKRIRNVVSYISIISLILSLFCVPIFADDGIRVQIDGQDVNFDIPPRFVNDRVMIPAKTFFEALGYSVEWNQHNQSFYAESEQNDKIIYMMFNNYYMAAAPLSGVRFRVEDSDELKNIF